MPAIPPDSRPRPWLVVALGCTSLLAASCDLLKPRDRPFNPEARSQSVTTIDASAIRPGQHLAGTLSLALSSLGSPGALGPVARTELYVDSARVSAAFDPPFVLTLDTHAAPEGPHQLAVLVYEVHPSTGIQGFVGAPSQALVTRVVFDQTPPTPVTLTSVTWENDRPRLTWSPNTDSNFAAYRVDRIGNWGLHLGFPAPITSQATASFLDTAGLRALIGVRYDYRVAVSNRDREVTSNALTLHHGDVVPGLHFDADRSRPFPSPNSAELYVYDRAADSLEVFSTVTQALTRSFRPPTGSVLTISRDGATLILMNDVLLGGIPGLATYAASTFAPLTSVQMSTRFGGYSIVAGRDDRVYLAGPTGLHALRVSDATVVGQLPLALGQARLALSPDASTLYAATADSVYRVDVSTDAPQALERRRVAPAIADMQMSADGLRLYLGHTIVAPSNFVEILDAGTLATLGRLAPPGNEWLFGFLVTANHLYLTHARQDIPGTYFLAGSVVQYDRASLARIRSWDFVQVPSALAGSGDDQWLYASGLETWVVEATAAGPDLAGR